MAGTSSIKEGADVGLCFVLSTRCRYDTVVLRQIQVFLALFEPLDVP